MQGLFQFIYNYRAFLLFVLLEVLCGWLIVRNNTYQGAAFFNSSNHYAAKVMQANRDVTDYLYLKEHNGQLAAENARLQALYAKLSLSKQQAPAGYTLDSALAAQFRFIAARVVNNTTRYAHNHLTIDKGSLDGIKPGMGVISPQGVIGKVKSCSDHYATLTSLLHTDTQVSAQLKKNGQIGSVKWDGGNAGEISLQYIPRHVPVQKGDTVVTSSYNSIFPQGVMLGTIKEARNQGAETFYDITLNLSVNFNRLSYVYVIENFFKTEQDSLEKATIPVQYDEQ
jgi:rod shape-determining protein MreC